MPRTSTEVRVLAVVHARNQPESWPSWLPSLMSDNVNHSLVVSAALHLLSPDAFDLIIFDATHQPEQAVLWCQTLGERFAAPLLALLPGCDEAQALAVYAAGAGECIFQPLAPALLRAKVNAWLKRSSPFGTRDGYNHNVVEPLPEILDNIAFYVLLTD